MASARTLALALLATNTAAGHELTPVQDPDQAELAQEPELPSGVTPSDWSSIRASIDSHQHAIEVAHSGFEARNPGFDWTARFNETSALIQPADGGWSFGLALKAFGYANEMQYVDSPTFGTCVEGQRITYGWTDELSEWWINDARGFEHGFTVHERPGGRAASGASRLIFELDAVGNLSPKVNGARTGLVLEDDAGVTKLRYDGLIAFDANGDLLPAWLEVDDRRVRICVDDALAQYPILVDPIVQEAYIKASNTDAGDFFGRSIAASGDTVVVGAIGDDSAAVGVNGAQSNVTGFSQSGAAYVFVRSGSSWTQQAYLKASNTGLNDSFGDSVAISGDTVVVGAPREDGDGSSSVSNSGAAYVFVRSGSSWTQQAYLKASNAGIGDRFGESVAVSGDTLVVGAEGESSSATGINGDQADNSASLSGAAYVFERAGITWTQVAYIKASNTDEVDWFGSSVAASGDTIVVAARFEDSGATGVDGDQADNSAESSGAVYVYARAGSSWSQQAYLKASNAESLDGFGTSVAVSGDTIVVGAQYEDSNATGVDGDELNNSAGLSGAAYVFSRTGSTWVQEAYLKASNTGGGDEFGFSVSVSDDTVLVGAPAEKSSATGVDGNQSSNNASRSGAVYVFARSGSSWAQQAYLKASNTAPFDVFGASVALSAGTAAVGAFGEDSSATGIGGDQSSNAAGNAGAVYVFDGVGGVGAAYCSAAVNSTGGVGHLAGSGSASTADNSLTLVATGLPPMAFGFFLTSTVQDFVMNPGGSEGSLCLGGAIGRYVGAGQIQQADASGDFSLLLDLTSTPQPSSTVSINAGETWSFQAWHRDSNLAGSTSNFTNGLEVVFAM